LLIAIGLGCINRCDTKLYEPVKQGIGILSFVGQQRARDAHVLHQGNRFRDIHRLTSRQIETQAKPSVSVIT